MTDRNDPAPPQDARRRTLQEIHAWLNLPAGQLFMDELDAAWNPPVLHHRDPIEMAANVAYRDAYYFIKALQEGVAEHELD